MGSAQRPRERGFGWLAWIVLGAAWFATLQVRALLDPDEGRYAEIPREMLASGDWVTPRFDGLKYFEKPALQYWATAAVYRAAGLHAWTARLWTVGLAFACLPMVYGWAARFYGPGAALAALAALAVSPFFAVVGHLDLLDAGFTFWLTAAVLAFTCAQSAAPRSTAERRWMLTAWAAAALAVLSKGIVVGVLAGTALILYTLIGRDTLTWRRLHPVKGVALFVLIAAPWFVIVSLRNPRFAQFFFIHEHFTRFLTTVHQRVEPWWYFVPLLIVGVLPWAVPLVRAARAGWAEAAAPAEADAAGAFGQSPPAHAMPVMASRPDGPHFLPRRFLLIYAAVTLVFFSASGSKLAPYILPMLPVLAAVVGPAVADPGKFAAHVARAGAVLVLAVAAGLLIYSARRNAFVPHSAIAWAAAAVAAALAGVALSLRRWRGTHRRAVLAAGLSAVLAWQFLLCAYTVIPPARSARALVAAVRDRIGPETRLYSVGQYRESVSPYLGRTLQLVDYAGELKFGLQAEPAKGMTREEFLRRWRADGDAVAFFDPGVWDAWRRQGFPGRVIGADDYTVAVSRL